MPYVHGFSFYYLKSSKAQCATINFFFFNFQVMALKIFPVDWIPATGCQQNRHQATLAKMNLCPFTKS